MPDFIKPENLQVGNAFGGASGAGAPLVDSDGLCCGEGAVVDAEVVEDDVA
jgi:hypothetical protein